MSWTLFTAAFLFLGSGLAFCLVQLRALREKRKKLEAFSQKLLQAHERERKRIAAELHGRLGQSLLIMKNRADLGLASPANVPAMAEQLKEISALCSGAIEETRRTARYLGPGYLEQLGLAEALDAMIEQVASSTGIHVERKVEPVDDLLTTEAATNVYRIAQEALNNVMRHAGASSARVHLIRDLRDMQLIVEDNGCGFEPRVNGDQRNDGLGLAEIGERVRILRGKLKIESHRGRGTSLTITIPFDEEKSAATK
jgi:two-component system NarL family sensor kinase